MATARIWGSTTDNYLQKSVSSSNWAACLAATPSVGLATDHEAYLLRSMPEAGTYNLTRVFLAFDLSSYVGATINIASVHLFSKATPTGTVTTRLYYQDWGTSLEAGDWVDRSGLTIASLADLVPAATDAWYWASLTSISSLLSSNGRFLVCMSDETTEPTASNVWSFYLADEETATQYRPYLDIDYTPAINSAIIVTSSAGDGYTYTDKATWALGHDAASADSVNYTSTSAPILTQNLGGTEFFIERGMFVFDTSVGGAKPLEGRTITSASVRLFDDSADRVGGTLCLCGSTQASATVLEVADHSRVTTTEYADRLVGTCLDQHYYEFPLNAAGLAYINKTGLTKFSLRGAHDVDDTAPESDTADLWTFSTSEHATASRRAALIVNYYSTVIALRDEEHHVEATGATSLTLHRADITGLTDGDILLAGCRVGRAGGATLSLPSGFTEITRYSPVADAIYAIGWKRAASEASDYVFDFTNTSYGEAGILAFSGCIASGDPVDVYSSTAYNTSNTIVRGASVTTTVPNTMLALFAWALDATNQTFTPPSELTEAFEDYEATDQRSIGFAYGGQDAVGASQNKDYILGTTATAAKHAFLVALKPLAGYRGFGSLNGGLQTPFAPDMTGGLS